MYLGYINTKIMGYSKFKKLETVTKKFGLSAKREMLFTNIVPFAPSSWLVETLQIAQKFPLRNEKVKSERIVSPMLVEVANFYENYITLFSGEELIIKPKENLSGACDFFFTLIPNSAYLESPIISLVEAKDEDMDYGIAQCAAPTLWCKTF